MYSLNLSRPTPGRLQPAKSVRRIRDGEEFIDPVDPLLGDLGDDVVAVDEPTVSAVTPVDPQVKKFRATVVRTVTQTAIVEFEALETQAQMSMAEDLAAQVPSDSWTTDPSNSWCYLDKIEDMGPATGAPETDVGPEELAEDDTLSDDDEQDDEEMAPATAGRSRRRRRSLARRSTPDEFIAQGQTILDAANAARNSLGGSGVEPWNVVATLEECQMQIQDLQSSIGASGSGDEIDIGAEANATQFLNDAAYEISEMLAEARADAAAAESEVQDAIHDFASGV